MFPFAAYRDPELPGFPRVRGDVPSMAFNNQTADVFSPRARGCSYLPDNSCVPTIVFPACAGMFPPDLILAQPYRRFPRVRGDVPLPVEWIHFKKVVFPACAGMFLRIVLFLIGIRGFPACAGMFPHG